MSHATITTYYGLSVRSIPDGLFRKESLNTVRTEQSDSSSSLSSLALNEDPRRINYFEIESTPSKSKISSIPSSEHYGVLQKEQQLTIDFTPVDGVDDDKIVLKKCNDFWNFVAKNPKLKGFCAMPEPVDDRTYSSSVDEEEDDEGNSMESLDDANLKNHVALCIMKNNEKILDTFMTKPSKVCEPLAGDYSFGPGPSPLKRKLEDKSWLRKCDSMVGRRNLMDGSERLINRIRAPDPAVVEVLKLCQEMEDWDMTHHKKMLTPRPVPALSHAILQRKP